MGSDARARDIASMVVGLAIGSSLTPFVPVPFVDDWIYGRLLRRIAAKVLQSREVPGDPAVITDAFLKAGDSGLATKAAVTVGRVVVRKLAMILDVKRSHDVFGEAIAFALALDAAAGADKVWPNNGERVGLAIHTSMQTVGSGLIDAMTRAGREAFSGGKPHERVMEAIGKHVDEAYGHLDRAMRHELR